MPYVNSKSSVPAAWYPLPYDSTLAPPELYELKLGELLDVCIELDEDTRNEAT